MDSASSAHLNKGGGRVTVPGSTNECETAEHATPFLISSTIQIW
jgi:hypothetical protein